MVKKTMQVQKINSKKTAQAMMKNKPVSLKYSTEIISNIKGKRVDKSLAWLQRIINEEEFLPLRKYNKKIGHKKGASKGFTKIGRYPKRCLTAFVELLESVQANADYKGLDSENLLITHMFASQGFQRASYQSQGRISGKRRQNKSTHLEIVVMEAK
ncbi:MAG: 50S ribosomal protein L22 [Candidatus Diapherotrites archaeon]|uniref:50S ribosomal protein L22 n=1 Tax=Candidatus Iainarchaeum sp. TaxID=3101447 RepID=A0A2D6LPA1_9ARCH|nr:50S ribosomal protein L22 [Candidatus Diapherotrites archaeon]|tara:strand:+ start:4999 stop:5469 length:471 start_codon:yes stop_codon:yes gene_type:complete